MSKVLKRLLMMAVLAVSMSGGKAYAVPTLQLDISGDTYYIDETIVTYDSVFTLYAYLTLHPGEEALLGSNFYVAFDVDRSLLSDDFLLHFDLYNRAGDFAPFSHDATAAVPEPSTIMLLGIGLIALWIWERKARREIS